MNQGDKAPQAISNSTGTVGDGHDSFNQILTPVAWALTGRMSDEACGPDDFVNEQAAH